MGDARIIPIRRGLERAGSGPGGADEAQGGEILGIRFHGPDIYDEATLTYQAIAVSELRVDPDLTPERVIELERNLFGARWVHILEGLKDDDECKGALEDLIEHTSSVAREHQDEEFEALIAEMLALVFGPTRAAKKGWRRDIIARTIAQRNSEGGTEEET